MLRLVFLTTGCALVDPVESCPYRYLYTEHVVVRTHADLRRWLQRCKAAVLAKERAEMQVAQFVRAEQRLTAQVRALKQLNEHQERQLLQYTHAPSALATSSEAVLLTHSGSDSTSVGKARACEDEPAHDFSSTCSPQKFERSMQQAGPASPVLHGTPGALTAGTRGSDWELDLAWAALEERRAVLEELLRSGPMTSPTK